MKKLLSLALLCCCIWAMQGQFNSRIIGGAASELHRHTVQTPDGGFVSTFEQLINNQFDYSLIKTDANGGVVWSKQYYKQSTEEFISKMFVDGNDLLLVGYAQTPFNWNPGYYHVVLIRINSTTGNVVGRRTFSILGHQLSPHDVLAATRLANGDIIVGGSRIIPNSYDDPFAMRINPTTGTMLWYREYEISLNASWFMDMIELGNGNILAGGGTPTANQFFNAFYMVLDPNNGSIIGGNGAVHVLEHIHNEQFVKFLQLPASYNNEIVAMGSQANDVSTRETFGITLTRFSANGAYIANSQVRYDCIDINNAYVDYPTDIIFDNDNLVISGVTSYGETNPNIVHNFLLSINALNGNVNWGKMIREDNLVSTTNTGAPDYPNFRLFDIGGQYVQFSSTLSGATGGTFPNNVNTLSNLSITRQSKINAASSCLDTLLTYTRSNVPLTPNSINAVVSAEDTLYIIDDIDNQVNYPTYTSDPCPFVCTGFNATITGINLTYPVSSCGNNVNILISGGAASLPAQVQSNWIGGSATPLIANSNTFNIPAQCPQTFHDIITSAQGCKDTIYYTIPTCVDTNVCVGSSIILSAWDDKFHPPFTTGNQITGSWQTNGVASGTGATLTINPTTNTNYIFNGQLNNVVNGVSTFVQFVNFCVNVNLTTPPTLTATASPATICAGQTSTLSVTGGGMNAMYRWYRMPATNLGTGMTKVVSPAVTTTYYAIVDCVPCTDTVWVTVNVVQPTQATITGPSAICGTQAVSLVATGGSSYAWKLSPFASIIGTAATLNVASVNTTRTYTVTATNAPCPTTSASHTITVNPIPNVSLPLPTGCKIVGQPLTFNATSTSNIATWNWGNNPNTPTGVTSTANTSAATYTMVSGTNTNIVSLSVTDVNGCSKSTSVSVSPNNLVATIAQPTQSGPCNSRKFTVSLSGLTSAAGTVVSYNWVFKNITQSTQVTQTTTTNTATQVFAAPGIDVYEVCVTITTSLGCTTSACMTPNLPACSCNIAANFCTSAGTPPAAGTAIPVIFNNTSTGGGATGLQYVWNWGDGTANTTSTSTAAITHNFASTLASSNVELTVTGTSNGMQCCQKVNIPVTIPKPCPITSTNVTGFNYKQNATGSITFASNLVAPTGCTYLWSFGNNTTSSAISPTYTYPVAGTYTACLTIIHTATGCSKTFCQNIIAAPAPNCNLIPRYVATRCTGAPLDISFNVVNNTAGTAPTNVTYSWTFGDGTSDVTTSPSISHTFPSTGNYVVCLQKVTPNCSTTVCHNFDIQMPTYANCSPAPTGLKTTKGDDKGNEEELVPLDGNNWLLNKVEIVPNPAKNITNLHFALANDAEVRMEAYTMEGKGVWEKTTTLLAGQQNEEINLLGWAAGMYIIRVTTGEEVQNIKLVVEN